MSVNCVYISHRDHAWNTDTVLAVADNIDQLINSHKEYDCHTSPEDASFAKLGPLLDAAKKICVIDLDALTLDQYPNSFSLYGRLLNLLRQRWHKVNWPQMESVVNVNFNKTPARSAKDTILWTAGCSITAGQGVHSTQRFGSLLCHELNLREISLSKPGASITYAADSLLRADILSGDIVVWGLTCPGRTEIADKFSLQPCTIENYLRFDKDKQYWNIDYFSSSTLIIKQIQQIFQVINFCKKIKARLYLANLLDLSWLPVVFATQKNFIDLTNTNSKTQTYLPEFVDLGSDNSHPGPNQHRKYAEQILNLIKEDNHGQTI